MAATVGFLVYLASLGTAMTMLHGSTGLASILGIPTLNTGIFGGILIGGIAAWLYNRYHDIKLPLFLAFFGGERFVPIFTVLASLAAGLAMSVAWPPVGNLINHFSQWAAYKNPEVAFTIYGTVERLLVPFGLNQVWNAPFFFEVGAYTDPATAKVVTGELARFAVGDPTAGNLAGGYLFKMFGLPAAALAIWHSAKPENRAKVGSLMISAAITSFLTGITEPIEFAFLFVSPLLYVIHAVLSGLAFGLCIFLGIKHGVSFAHGLTDYIIYFPLSENALWIIPIGLAYAALYYAIFTVVIRSRKLVIPALEKSAPLKAEGPATPAPEPVSD